MTVLKNQQKTELLFPTAIIPELGKLRGETWTQIINDNSSEDTTTEELMSFVLLMVRLCGCVSCNSDSYRALKGCMHCATQTIKRFRGTDEALREQLEDINKEITQDHPEKIREL